MTRTSRNFLLTLNLLVAPAMYAAVLPSDTVVAGKTIPEWTAECWKWIYGLPTNQNPLLDCEGRWANNRQPDETVFLIASVNGLRPPPCVRSFTVPDDKFILLPVFVIAIDNVDTVPPLTVEQMHDTLNGALGAVTGLHATIDGVTVPNLLDHRATSPVFTFDFNADNILTINYQHPVVGLLDPLLIDGYWLMLEPLEAGQHILHTGGAIPIFFPHDIICNITVVPVPLPESVAKLILDVAQSILPTKEQQSLLVSLKRAKASFESGNLTAGIGQLKAFQNKVRAQVAADNPALANQLSQAAQRIIDKAVNQPTKRKPKSERREGET